MAELVKLVSSGTSKSGRKTGYFKVVGKNKKTHTEKIKRKLFDPRAFNTKTGKTGMRTEFVESGKP